MLVRGMRMMPLLISPLVILWVSPEGDSDAARPGFQETMAGKRGARVVLGERGALAPKIP